SAAAATAADPFAGMSAEDADTHRKAQRFARLLVDEIKLYNQAKVAEGRRNKDLYDRLKEDIDKSRSTFQKRYGNTAAASGDYFQREVVRSLAEDDNSVMGANFRKYGLCIASNDRFRVRVSARKCIRWVDWVSSGCGCSRWACCAGF